MKLRQYLQALGYGTRREVEALIAAGRVTDAAGGALYVDDEVGEGAPARGGHRLPHAALRLDGAPLDPAPGLLAALHKPVGVTCSTKDPGRLVYDLLPPRWKRRDPIVSPVGRLDKDTSGLLLLTDDGPLLHRLTHPRRHLPKVYRVRLAEALRGDEAARFAAGTLMLEGETKPLLPAALEVLGEREARLTLHEGRYHQVRRMFAATGNAVLALHREAIGGLALDALGLAAGEWCLLDAAQRALLLPGEARGLGPRRG
ncbi:pseudouridine synthase [Silanimonas lenta]|uniref:pseudouridine synthase n=1 Tax=Silanimonas lenta TaxID=265429 RepID=UPI00068410A9|nr:16S rRNA pseudouridine(516) synthase [Silanimonas lenta]